ncbi:MAG: CapA family protein [Chloroflexi bacterium]|nr:CapA family protein [Chloroflexota bacterium]
MGKEFTLAIAGDIIINRRISIHADEKFLRLIQVIRDADVGFANLEGVIHDYIDPECYPCAEPGWTYTRCPRFTPDELKWAGFDMLSHAGNHSLDYSYGGLYSTWKALDEAGIPYAGTGRNLGNARSPAYLETPKGRVALISMCCSFAGFSRAGDTRPDAGGRPGLNPLRFYYRLGPGMMEQVKSTFMKLGYTCRQQGKMLLINPPGLNLSLTRFEPGDSPGVETAVDEDDAEGNLRAIRDARRQADWVIVQLHSHWTDWNAERGHLTSTKCIPPFARACVDAGADVFVEEGGAVLLKGIEVYKGKPIIYDPGEFLRMSNTVTRLPADFYQRWGYPPGVRRPEATPSEAFEAHAGVPKPLQPPGAVGFNGAVVDVLTFGEDGRLRELKVYPIEHWDKPRSLNGVPKLAEGETAKKILNYLARVSAPYGTKLDISGDTAAVRL